MSSFLRENIAWAFAFVLVLMALLGFKLNVNINQKASIVYVNQLDSNRRCQFDTIIKLQLKTFDLIKNEREGQRGN